MKRNGGGEWISGLHDRLKKPHHELSLRWDVSEYIEWPISTRGMRTGSSHTR
jgi:hypothetical protein